MCILDCKRLTLGHFIWTITANEGKKRSLKKRAERSQSKLHVCPHRLKLQKQFKVPPLVAIDQPSDIHYLRVVGGNGNHADEQIYMTTRESVSLERVELVRKMWYFQTVNQTTGNPILPIVTGRQDLSEHGTGNNCDNIVASMVAESLGNKPLVFMYWRLLAQWIQAPHCTDCLSI